MYIARAFAMQNVFGSVTVTAEEKHTGEDKAGSEI